MSTSPMHAAITATTVPGTPDCGYPFARAMARTWLYSANGAAVVQQRINGAVTLALNITARDYDSQTFNATVFNANTQEWTLLGTDIAETDMRGDNWFPIEWEQAEPVPVPGATVIPRTAESAIGAANALAVFAPEHEAVGLLRECARYLPGGEMNTRGHELAAQIALCGEYESIVCPVFGWLPRRGSESRPTRLIAQWETALLAMESEHSVSPISALRAFLAQFDSGSVANRALVEHADNHLEQHKRASVNALLSELVPDWEPVPVVVRHTYEVDVEVTRTFTARQTVTVTVECDADDDVSDYIDCDMLASECNANGDWDIDWDSTSHYDVDDWNVEDTRVVE